MNQYNYTIVEIPYKNKWKFAHFSQTIINAENLEIGSYIFLKHKNKKTCVTVTANRALKFNQIGIDIITKEILDLDDDDDIIEIEKLPNNAHYKIVKSGTLTIAIMNNKVLSSNNKKNYDTQFFNSEIETKFKNTYLTTPISVNDIFPLKIQDTEIKLKVVKIVPENVIISLSLSTAIILKKEEEIIELKKNTINKKKKNENELNISSSSSLQFENIGGLKKVKKIIQERILLPLEYPQLYKQINNTIIRPKGVLLYGPPGTGKTLLMKTLAAQCKNCSFYELSASDAFNKYYGEGEKKIADVFEEARNHAPAIIFIDEFDTIASKRKDTSAEAEQRVIGKLLTEIDGLKDSDDIIVVASTNRPNSIDPAFRRAKRFDYEIEFEPPNAEDRYEILSIYTKNISLAPDVDLKALANKTKGYVGSDLYGLVSEAIMQAISRQIKEKSTQTISQLKNKDITIIAEDFNNAFLFIKPASIREIEYEVQNITLNDIVGITKCKELLYEHISMQLSELRTKKSFLFNTNILFYGFSGCGKTMLGHAIANEFKLNFFYLKSFDIVYKWGYDRTSVLKETFKKAKQFQPSIIFIDDIDTIALKTEISSSENENILSQLFSEIDNIGNHNIMVIATTSQPYILNPLLFKSNRFNIRCFLSLPNDEERIELFKKFLNEGNISYSISSWSEIVSMTKNFTPFNIKCAVQNAIFEYMKSKESSFSISYIYSGIKKIISNITDTMIQSFLLFEKNSITNNERNEGLYL